jgi:hypothetical protein
MPCNRSSDFAICLMSALLACAVTTPVACSQHHKTPDEDYSDKTVTVPRFAIAIKLSPLAEKRLHDLHETIKVLAMFDGDPLPGQGHFNAPMRDVYLGSDEKLVDVNNTVKFDDTKISERHWKQLADKNYYVTVNVVSARKTYRDNLLDCSEPIDQHIDTLQGKIISVPCRLIGESNASTR